MKRVISWALAIMVAWTSLVIMPPTAQAHWAENYINKWKDYGILKGIDTKNYDRQLTKTEVETILGRFEGVEKVSLEDIIISREAIVYKLMKEFDIDESRTINKARKFKDFDEISGEYAFYIEGAIEAGLINVGEEGFSPKAPIALSELVVLLDNIADQTINKIGQYTFFGEDANTFDNLIISEDYVTLTNATINGNLYIAPGIGDGGVTLTDTVVKGKMVVLGGGEAIRFENSTIKELVVKKENFPVTIVSDGGSTIENTKIKSDAKLREQFHTELGFVNLEIGDIEAFARVEVDGEFGNVNVNEQSLIDLIGETKIANLQFVSAAKESTIRTSEDVNVEKIVATDMTLPENIGDIDEINVTQPRERTIVKGHVKKVNVQATSFVDIQKGAIVDELIVGPKAGGTTVYLDYNSLVKSFTTNTVAKVLGDGQVEVATINSNGVEINKELKGLKFGEGITSVKVGTKIVKEEIEAPDPKTPWENYLIRTKLTNLISIPSKEAIRLVIRKKDKVEKADEPMISWAIENGKGINYSYIDPYTGVIEAQGDGKMTVTAYNSDHPEWKTSQEIYVGNPDKWSKYPYRDYNMYTGLEITCPTDEDLYRLRDKHNYQLKAELSPKHIKDGKVEWSISYKHDKDIKAQISQTGYLMIADESDKGEIWVTAKVKGESHDIIAQREFYVRKRYDDDLIDGIDFTLEAEKMPEDGTMVLTPVIETDDIKVKEEDKKKIEWKVDILDGRFVEYPTMDKNVLKANGQGRVLVTLHTTDESDLYKQKIIDVENVTYTDIAKAEKEEPVYEFDNAYYEKEQGVKITSTSGVYSVREIAGQLRLEAKSTENKTLAETTWDVSQIDGDIYQMAIDSQTGLLSVSGKGRVLVTVGALVDGASVMARKVITVGNVEYQDEKPTIFLNLYIDDKKVDEDEPSIEQDKRYTFKVEDFDEKEYKNTDLTWTVTEKEDTIKEVELTSSGKIEVEGYGKIMIQAYGTTADQDSWLIGYKEIIVEKDDDDKDKDDDDDDDDD